MSFFSRLNFEFSINTLCVGILILILGSGIASYALTTTDSYQPLTGSLPVPVQVGRNKLIVSKTGDASMATEYRRRRAIIGSNSCGVTPKFSHSGSTNGSLESYFLSSMCPTFVRQAAVCTSIFDGGNANSEFCNILDGNGGNVIVDGGYAITNVCN